MRTNSNYQKRMSVINPSLNLNDDKELSLNDPDRVNQLYVAVLDHLLTPPHVKEQLMETQPLEKKIQMIKMHNHLFESMNSWGDKENMLLASIQKMKVPDIPSLSRLKIILATGNMEMMTSFLDSGGVSILLKAIENRLHKKPLTELDIAVLFELLSCCKAVMKNSVGMEGVAQVQGSIDIIAKCLRFDYKQFALQILEILSVCAFYSEEMAMKVLHGMKVNARFYQESPFACLAAALVDQDIEVKAAVMQFVNALIMAIGETKLRLVFRSELKSQLFDERIESAVQQVDRELAFLIAESNGNNNAAKSFENASNPNDPSSKQRKLTRKSMVTIFGPRAYDERKVDAMIKNVQVMNATLSDTGSIIGNGIEIKSNSFTINVNPLDGTMAGLLHAAKNAEKIESRFLDMVGGKKTKRRWYELDSENFKWCSGHDKEQDYKGTVKVSTITDIRPYTTDVNVAAECQHCFEIETTDRTYALGCETATEKDNWLTALQRCRDNYLMSKGSYKLQFRELSTQDVMKFSEMFKKQTNNYQAIAVEDQKYQMELVGLDLTNIIDVSRYLQLESIAMGNGNNLMKIFYELLLIPAGAEGLWDGILFFLKMIREKGIKEENKIKGIVDEHSPVFLEMLKKKFKESGGAYTQMSKLALSLISSEQEISRLQRQLQEQQLIVQENEKKLKNLEIELEKTITSGNAFKFSATNPILAMKNAAAAANNNTNNSGNAGGNASASPLASKSSDNNNNAATQPSAGGDGKQAVNSLPTSIPPPIPSNAPASVASPVVDVPPPAAVPAGIMDPRFEKYEKMKKMLPEGAVRQKMQMDGFADHEIEAFLNGTLPLITPAATSALPPPPLPPVAAPTDSRFEKYEKMKKMLPEGAVRQKMSLDGFTEDEIEGFFNGTLPAAAPAPPVAAPAAADPRFEKYEKMKKMLPEGAVRQKMSLDGFTEQEIDGFFNGTLPAAAAPAPAAPAAIDPKLEKFEKMRKMLPEGAVRQKMQLEGISPDEIEAFFNGTLGAAAAAPPAAAAQPDPRYEKFEKMKKMLPEGAVRQKMQLEGFTPEEIDNFMAGKVPMIGGGAGGPAAPAVAAAPPDPRFEKFEKMRKMLPEGAVRQKMSLEGFTDQEIERFFNPGAAPGPAGGLPAAPKPAMPKAPPKPVEEEPPEGMKAKPKIKPNTKLRGLFWNKIKSQEIKETIWYKLSEYSLTSEEIAKLEEHFSNKAVDPNAAGSSANKDSSKASNQPKLVSVLDGKRTQNVLILLGKLRKSPEDVLTMIISLEPQILTQELTNSLTEIIPTPEGITLFLFLFFCLIHRYFDRNHGDQSILLPSYSRCCQSTCLPSQSHSSSSSTIRMS